MQGAGRYKTGTMEDPCPSGSIAGGMTRCFWTSKMLLEVYIWEIKLKTWSVQWSLEIYEGDTKVEGTRI